MRFVIPWSFCVSKRDKNVIVRRQGRCVLKHTDKWKLALRTINLCAASQYKGPPLEDDVKVDFYMVMPSRNQRDPQNYMEVIFDGLEGVAYLNDKQAKQGEYYLIGYDRANARIVVDVSLATPLLEVPPPPE
jgi:Holliday junction resolvase RusA-like endonuclease